MRSRLLRRGVSTILAIVIGIVVTIAVGAALYYYVFGMMHHMTSSAKTVNIDSFMVFATPTGSNTTIFVTLSNPNNINIKSVSMTVLYQGKIIAQATWTYTTNVIQPGQTRSFHIYIWKNGTSYVIKAADSAGVAAASATASGTAVPGYNIDLVVTVTFSNGASYTASASAVVHSM